MAPSRPRRSRTAHFKVPFIVSMAAPAAFGIGCGGRADPLDHDRMTGDVVTDPDVRRPVNEGVPGDYPIFVNPPMPFRPIPPLGCPSSLPQEGEPCAMGNPDCHYDDCQGSASCVEGRWEVYDVSCNPPPLSDECPALLPEYGSSCSEYALGLTCDYEYCYESMPLVRCNELGAWEELPVPTCNPPPPDEECSVVPVPGSDCASEGVECLYDGCEGPGSSYARCEFGQWFVHYSSGPACNPPAVVPVCPVIEPQALAGCAYEGQLCDYGDCAQAELTRQFTCATGSWQRVDGVCGGAP